MWFFRRPQGSPLAGLYLGHLCIHASQVVMLVSLLLIRPVLAPVPCQGPTLEGLAD